MDTELLASVRVTVNLLGTSGVRSAMDKVAPLDSPLILIALTMAVAEATAGVVKDSSVTVKSKVSSWTSSNGNSRLRSSTARSTDLFSSAVDISVSTVTFRSRAIKVLNSVIVRPIFFLLSIQASQ